MRRILAANITSAAFVLFTFTLTHAQSPENGPKLPSWDAGFSLGVFSNASRDEQTGSGTSPHFEGRLDVGHYWTQHVKTEVGVSFLKSWSDYSAEDFTGRGYTLVNMSQRMAAVTPTVTYQFLENQFAHPYVSAGLRIGALHTDWVRYGYGVSGFGGASTSGQRSVVLVRPMAAAGYKWYFNERTFVRGELQNAFGPDVTPHLSFRFGFGFDF